MGDIVLGTPGTTVLSESGGNVTFKNATIDSGVTFPSGKFIPLKGITHSEGSTTASGSDALLLSISVTLTNYTNYLLYAWAHTAITENSNHSNVSRLKIQLDNGSSNKQFATQRQGIGAHTDNITYTTNTPAMISCQGYYVIENAYATSCTLQMRGGMDGGGQFSWGDSGSYTGFDGETPAAGGTLGFLLFHP